MELKPTLLSLIGSHPFVGMDHEDPYTHLSTFMGPCNTMGASDEDVEVVYLKAFPFSMAGKAKTWLQSHPNKSLNEILIPMTDVVPDVTTSRFRTCRLCLTV